MTRAYCELGAHCRSKSEKMCKRCSTINRNKSPEMRAAVSTYKKGRPIRMSPLANINSHTPEAKAKRAITMRRKYLGWCPTEYLDLYRKLTRNGPGARFTAAEAKEMVLEQVAKDAKNAPLVIAENLRLMHEKEARRKAQEY